MNVDLINSFFDDFEEEGDPGPSQVQRPQKRKRPILKFKDPFSTEGDVKPEKKKTKSKTSTSEGIIKLPAPFKKSERLVKLTASDIQILKTIPKSIVMQLEGVSVPAVKRYVAWIKYRKIMSLDAEKRIKALLDGALTFKKNDKTVFNKETMKTEKK